LQNNHATFTKRDPPALTILGRAIASRQAACILKTDRGATGGSSVKGLNSSSSWMRVGRFCLVPRSPRSFSVSPSAYMRLGDLCVFGSSDSRGHRDARKYLKSVSNSPDQEARQLLEGPFMTGTHPSGATEFAETWGSRPVGLAITRVGVGACLPSSIGASAGVAITRLLVAGRRSRCRPGT